MPVTVPWRASSIMLRPLPQPASRIRARGGQAQLVDHPLEHACAVRGTTSGGPRPGGSAARSRDPSSEASFPKGLSRAVRPAGLQRQSSLQPRTSIAVVARRFEAKACRMNDIGGCSDRRMAHRGTDYAALRPTRRCVVDPKRGPAAPDRSWHADAWRSKTVRGSSCRASRCARRRWRTTARRSSRCESRSEEPVSTNALAERLGITPGSVSAMLKKLDEQGLIARVPYRGVRLTADGRRVALEVIRHHRLLELFLAETLQMPWDRVHAEAEVLEHVISEELEQLIAAKLGDPTRDPHGDPIPSAELELPERETQSQPRQPAGGRGRRVRARLGLRPGDAAVPVRARHRPGRALEVHRAPAVRRPAVGELRGRRARARDRRPAGARDARRARPRAAATAKA